MTDEQKQTIIGSLLSIVQKSGFTLDYVDDGSSKITLQGTLQTRWQQAKDLICNMGAAYLQGTCPNGTKGWLALDLNLKPDEIVNAWYVTEDISAAIQDFSAKLEKFAMSRTLISIIF